MINTLDLKALLREAIDRPARPDPSQPCPVCHSMAWRYRLDRYKNRVDQYPLCSTCYPNPLKDAEAPNGHK